MNASAAGRRKRAEDLLSRHWRLGTDHPIHLGLGAGPALGAVVTVLSSLALAGCNGSAASPTPTAAGQQPSVTVSVGSVKREPVSRSVSTTGTVAAWEELVIGSQASGLAVIDVRIKENDAVRAGDLMVSLDNRSLIAQVAQQKAAIAEARATLDSSKQESTRAEALVAQKAMSVETMETRRTAVRTSQAKLDQALASLDQLQTQLDQTTIRAPADGIVAQTPVLLGTVVQMGTELVRLIRDGRIEVQAKVPERDLQSIRIGQGAIAGGVGESLVTGHVRDVAAKVDATTRLGIAYIGLPKTSPFRPGMFATVAIAVERQDALTIPEQSLVWPNGKAATFVLSPANIAVMTPVTTGVRQNGRVAITVGLKTDDRIVVAGAGFLHDGDTVRVEAATGSDTAETELR